jgi:hypothetical protein
MWGNTDREKVGRGRGLRDVLPPIFLLSVVLDMGAKELSTPVPVVFVDRCMTLLDFWTGWDPVMGVYKH